MAQNIIKSSKEIVKAALAAVPQIGIEEALQLIGRDDHVFVDLRDGTEQTKTGTIPNAVASSRGMIEFHIDPASPAHKPEFAQDKTYVFYCASGGRSALAAVVAMIMVLEDGKFPGKPVSVSNERTTFTSAKEIPGKNLLRFERSGMQSSRCPS